MAIEWDPRKARANLQKHGVHFADAAAALDDDHAMTIREDHPSEQRWITLGMDSLARLVVLVYTWRGDRVRLISARLAAPSERRSYEEENR